MGDKQWCLNKHDGGRNKAFGPDWTHWKWKTSDCTQMDMVEVGSQHSGSIQEDRGGK